MAEGEIPYYLFIIIGVVVLVIVAGIIGAAGWYFWKKSKKNKAQAVPAPSGVKVIPSEVSCHFCNYILLVNNYVLLF